VGFGVGGRGGAQGMALHLKAAGRSRFFGAGFERL